MGKEFSIPVIALSQLARPAKGEKYRQPVLSDLRESGAIEQDADVVIFIHPLKSDQDERRASVNIELILAKQRNGPSNISTNKIVFFERACRFREEADMGEPS